MFLLNTFRLWRDQQRRCSSVRSIGVGVTRSKARLRAFDQRRRLSPHTPVERAICFSTSRSSRVGASEQPKAGSYPDKESIIPDSKRAAIKKWTGRLDVRGVELILAKVRRKINQCDRAIKGITSPRMLATDKDRWKEIKIVKLEEGEL